jgi:hypothetical protein
MSSKPNAQTDHFQRWHRRRDGACLVRGCPKRPLVLPARAREPTSMVPTIDELGARHGGRGLRHNSMPGKDVVRMPLRLLGISAPGAPAPPPVARRRGGWTAG